MIQSLNAQSLTRVSLFCLHPMSMSVFFSTSVLAWPHLFLFFVSFWFLCFQSVTAAEGQTSACLMQSSTGAQAVEGDVWAAETTPTGPTVSAAEKTTTGALLRNPACPATAILMVLYTNKPPYCLDITCKAIHNPCKQNYPLFLFNDMRN